MSFSKHIETYISWDNINEWKHWQFEVITVESTNAGRENWSSEDWDVFNQGRQNHYMYHKKRGE